MPRGRDFLAACHVAVNDGLKSRGIRPGYKGVKVSVCNLSPKGMKGSGKASSEVDGAFDDGNDLHIGDGCSGEDGSSGHFIIEVIILAKRTREVLGEKGATIKYLQSKLDNFFGFHESKLELFAERFYDSDDIDLNGTPPYKASAEESEYIQTLSASAEEWMEAARRWCKYQSNAEDIKLKIHELLNRRPSYAFRLLREHALRAAPAEDWGVDWGTLAAVHDRGAPVLADGKQKPAANEGWGERAADAGMDGSSETGTEFSSEAGKCSRPKPVSLASERASEVVSEAENVDGFEEFLCDMGVAAVNGNCSKIVVTGFIDESDVWEVTGPTVSDALQQIQRSQTAWPPNVTLRLALRPSGQLLANHARVANVPRGQRLALLQWLSPR